MSWLRREIRLKHKKHRSSERCFPLLHGILSICWIDDKLNYPVAAIIPETDDIPAGFAFCFMYPDFFQWSNYVISAGISLYHV
jgi:hypothetical protein